MSIEFQCPRCEATIRVPDNASGTTGSCPKCKTRLRVPAVAGPPPARSVAAPPLKPAPPPAPAASGPPATFEFPCPLCTAAVIVPLAAAGKNGKCPHCSGRIRVPHPAASLASRPQAAPTEPMFAPVPMAAPAIAPAGIPDFMNMAAEHSAPHAATTASATVPDLRSAPDFAVTDSVAPVEADEPAPRRRVRRRSILPILLPIAALALAIGGGIAYFVVRTTALEGELTAEPVTGELPHVAVERAYVDISDLPLIQQRLGKQPLSIESKPFTTLNLAASEGKLWATISVSPEGELFRVDPKQNAKLSKYAEKHKVSFDRQRTEDLVRDGPPFIIEVQKLMNEKGAASKMMEQFFGTIGLASLTKGLGYHVWADRGDRCVYEDAEGRLYFVLPRGTKKFEITGRDSLSPGHQKFLGKFQVKVAGSAVELPPVQPLAQPAKGDKSDKEKAAENPDKMRTSPEKDVEPDLPGMSEREDMKKPKKKLQLKDG